jgi:hypothetical protein
VTPLEKPSPAGDTGNEPVFLPAVHQRGRTRFFRPEKTTSLRSLSTRAPQAPAVRILFRNLILRASVNEYGIICGTGQQSVRDPAGRFPTLGGSMVLLSAQIAAEGRLGP